MHNSFKKQNTTKGAMSSGFIDSSFRAQNNAKKPANFNRRSYDNDSYGVAANVKAVQSSNLVPPFSRSPSMLQFKNTELANYLGGYSLPQAPLNEDTPVHFGQKDETPSTTSQVLRMSFNSKKAGANLQKSKLIQSCLLRAGTTNPLTAPFQRPLPNTNTNSNERRRSQTSLAQHHDAHGETSNSTQRS